MAEFCRAKFDYQRRQPDELGFKKGDKIEIIARIDDKWWKGKLNDKTGVFPRSFVEVLGSPGSKAAALSVSGPVSSGGGRSPLKSSAGGGGGNLSQREKVLNEVLQTEKDYVQDLQLVLRLYIEPLRQKQLLKDEDLDAIFCNWEHLLVINTRILKQLLLPGGQARSAAIFADCAPSLAPYGIYMANYGNDRLEKLKEKNSEFASFLSYAQSRPESRNLNLASLLVKPMQRVTKYPLLFRELLKATPKEHPQHNKVRFCVDALVKATAAVNEARRVAEEEALMKRLEAMDGGSKFVIEVKGRRLVREMRVRAFDATTTRAYTKAKKTVEKKVKDVITLDRALVRPTPHDGPQFEVVSTSNRIWVMTFDTDVMCRTTQDAVTELMDTYRREIVSGGKSGVENGNRPSEKVQRPTANASKNFASRRPIAQSMVSRDDSSLGALQGRERHLTLDQRLMAPRATPPEPKPPPPLIDFEQNNARGTPNNKTPSPKAKDTNANVNLKKPANNALSPGGPRPPLQRKRSKSLVNVRQSFKSPSPLRSDPAQPPSQSPSQSQSQSPSQAPAKSQQPPRKPPLGQQRQSPSPSVNRALNVNRNQQSTANRGPPPKPKPPGNANANTRSPNLVQNRKTTAPVRVTQKPPVLSRSFVSADTLDLEELEPLPDLPGLPSSLKKRTPNAMRR